MTQPATIVIPARNAATTIERAIASACAQGDHPMLLVDDFSEDGTSELARSCAGERLRVIRPVEHSTLGSVRRTGLLEVETPFGVWLDADDELLPGRVDRMIETLERQGGDLATDGVELFDGPSGAFREVLHVPRFLRGYHPLARLFERNYLPGVGVFGFRTSFAQDIGYDPCLHAAEDMDFVLRAIAGGARFCLLEQVGYRQYAYPQSLSRQIVNQRAMYKAALRKHRYEDVHRLYCQAGYDDRIATWGLVSMATYRQDYDEALQFMARLESTGVDTEGVLEPEGPCPKPERWRILFHRGTTLLLLGRLEEAVSCLEDAERMLPSAEAANNLAVARFKQGDISGGRTLCQLGLQRAPGFFDAQINLDRAAPVRVTTHPLRTSGSRRDYEAHAAEVAGNPSPEDKGIPVSP